MKSREHLSFPNNCLDPKPIHFMFYKTYPKFRKIHRLGSKIDGGWGKTQVIGLIETDECNESS